MTTNEAIRDLTRRLRRTDLLLLRAVRRQRARPAIQAKGQFWGSVITDDEVDDLLRAHGEIDYVIGVDGLDDALSASTAYRDAPGGKFETLRQEFQLDGNDIDLALLAFAPEVSAGYGKIFAYLNDNLNQAFLTVDLATRILETNREARLHLQVRLLPGAPLIQNRLLLLNPADGLDTHTSRRLHPAPRLLRWLFQGDVPPLELGASVVDTTSNPFIPAVTAERLGSLNASLLGPITVAVIGGTNGSREAVAMAIARHVSRPLVRVDVSKAKSYLDKPFELIRDLRLAGAIPLLENIPAPDAEPALRRKAASLGLALATLPYPIVASGGDRRTLSALLGADRPNVTVPVGRTTQAERVAAWESDLTARGWNPDKAPDIAERFYSIGGTSIPRVLERAKTEAGGEEPSLPQIWAACREAARPEFSGLAQRVVPKYNWDDLILPKKVKRQLFHLQEYLANQEKVFHEWGAASIRPRGYGIKALFSGGPGTGKTMCAEVIAGALGYDLFKVDLSSVISRWVGETEKNLKEIFDAAEGGSSVILFDEGDALFGSRGEVKQAQDRFANQEVSFLLQRLEVFEGCAIITTNLQQNIDEAFLRRFGVVVEFPLPTATEREALWARAIPAHAPRADDLDVKVLAEQFILAGGAIVNASINGLIMAASKNEPVAMIHLVTAIAQELQKNGKQVNKVHFGEYFDQIKHLV
jgi:AAA+ superfamily predicted ATPase